MGLERPLAAAAAAATVGVIVFAAARTGLCPIGPCGHGPSPEAPPTAAVVSGADSVPSDPAPGTTAPPPTQALAEPKGAGLTPVDQQMVRQIFAAFATGDFLGALRRAEASSEDLRLSVAYHAWLREQMPALLVSAGWSRLKLGDCDEALTYLQRAASLRRTPEGAKGLAVCLYKQKNMISAHEQFQAYLADTPNDRTMLLLYADVLESEGYYANAAAALQQVLAGEPGPSEAAIDKDAITARLSSMQGRVRESALQRSESSQHFRLTFRGGEHDDLVPAVMQTLEDALEEYHETYAMPVPSSPLEVVLYPASAFHGMVSYGPDWAEGLYDGRMRIPIRDGVQAADLGPVAIVLRHELSHALMAALNDSRRLPPWFDEGLAQRLSCTGRPCATFHFEAQPGAFLPPGQFMTPYLSLNPVNAGRAYRQSLFLILTLEAIKGDGALRQVLGSVTQNSAVDSDGLLAPLSLPFADLHARAAQYWGDMRLPGAGARE